MSALAEKIESLRENADWSMGRIWQYLSDCGYKTREIESAMNCELRGVTIMANVNLHKRFGSDETVKVSMKKIKKLESKGMIEIDAYGRWLISDIYQEASSMIMIILSALK